MKKVTTFLWFKDQAEAAASFYVSLFKKAKVTHVRRVAKGKSAPVMSVTFRIDGQEFIAFNGGETMGFDHTAAVSLFALAKNQKEVDRLWAKLTEGGAEMPCGWLRDRFGVHWQVVPHGLDKLIQDPRALEAMLTMKKLDLAALKAAMKTPKVKEPKVKAPKQKPAKKPKRKK